LASPKTASKLQAACTLTRGVEFNPVFCRGLTLQAYSRAFGRDKKLKSFGGVVMSTQWRINAF
jgi:hypothetical protein